LFEKAMSASGRFSRVLILQTWSDDSNTLTCSDGDRDGDRDGDSIGYGNCTRNHVLSLLLPFEMVEIPTF
jgi:hypothetical protein